MSRTLPLVEVRELLNCIVKLLEGADICYLKDPNICFVCPYNEFCTSIEQADHALQKLEDSRNRE